MKNYTVTFTENEWVALLSAVTIAEYDAAARKNLRLTKAMSLLRDKLSQREATQ